MNYGRERRWNEKSRRGFGWGVAGRGAYVVARGGAGSAPFCACAAGSEREDAVGGGDGDGSASELDGSKAERVRLFVVSRGARLSPSNHRFHLCFLFFSRMGTGDTC